MIYQVSGNLIAKHKDFVVIEVSGIGFKIRLRLIPSIRLSLSKKYYYIHICMLEKMLLIYMAFILHLREKFFYCLLESAVLVQNLQLQY